MAVALAAAAAASDFVLGCLCLLCWLPRYLQTISHLVATPRNLTKEAAAAAAAVRLVLICLFTFSKQALLGFSQHVSGLICSWWAKCLEIEA